jgi:hypothetical protein
VPGSKASLVIGDSLSIEGNKLFKRTNAREIGATQFPYHCGTLVGPDATAGVAFINTLLGIHMH